MEKVTCNVLYSPNCLVVNKNQQKSLRNIGSFAEKNDAEKGVNLYIKAVKYFSQQTGIYTLGAYTIEKFYEPEENASAYYKNLAEFIADNGIVLEYLSETEQETINEM